MQCTELVGCVYIGQGSEKRAKQSARARQGLAKIIATGLSKKQAQAMERELIEFIGIDNLENIHTCDKFKKGDKWDYWREWIKS